MSAAFDRERGFEVALKTLRHGGPSAVLRLKQEFRALSDLTHPNLLALYDLFVDDDRCFFSMELVDGVDFVSFVRHDAPAAPREVLESGASDDAPVQPRRPHARFDEARLRSTLEQLSAAVAALHTHGVCHRDLKPSNVLVRPDGHLLVLDYGLVGGAFDGATGAGFEGTAAYAAPEQARGSAGPAADGYAIGTMAFEAITGTLPFAGSPLQLLVDKAQRPASRLDAVVEGVPSDLVELVERLLDRDPEQRRLPGPLRETTLVGRSDELAVLDRALAAGGSHTVVIEGPSGIGKSTLVRAFLARASARGVVVLEGRCNPRETVSYNAFDGVIDALARELRRRGILVEGSALPRLFPVLGEASPSRREAVDADAIRRRGFAELRGLLERLGAVVVFVDDFQWADRDSQALLAELVLAPVLFVLARRGDPTPLPWGAERLELSPLPALAARELLEGILGPAHAHIDRLLSIAEGHPLFLQEIARAGDETPRDLEHALSARIGALPATRRALLELAGVAASPLPAHLLALAANQPVGQALRDLDALRTDRLVRTTDRGIEPFHDRVRDAVGSTLSDTQRRARHAALAVVLRERDDPRALVHHLAGAGDTIAAREAALDAARRAEESLAFEHAALLLRDALSHGLEGDGIRLRLAEALVHAHRGVEAAEVLLTIGARSASARVRVPPASCCRVAISPGTRRRRRRARGGRQPPADDRRRRAGDAGRRARTARCSRLRAETRRDRRGGRAANRAVPRRGAGARHGRQPAGGDLQHPRAACRARSRRPCARGRRPRHRVDLPGLRRRAPASRPARPRARPRRGDRRRDRARVGRGRRRGARRAGPPPPRRRAGSPARRGLFPGAHARQRVGARQPQARAVADPPPARRVRGAAHAAPRRPRRRPPSWRSLPRDDPPPRRRPGVAVRR
ncbi:MAG: AAA family ATPase [Myxococcales bacterium]|nr:AAA family ATPase [Myxococcales bacterium]